MGDTMTIVGGRPLYGAVRVPAAKNSVLPLLAAALLCDGRVRLQGVPRLSDVQDCLGLLQSVGMAACWQGADVVVAGGGPSSCRLPRREAERMRASVLFAAPLLARLGRVETVLPGGCRIGARPVDLHLEGLAQMGVQEQAAGEGRLVLTAPRGLHGADFTLRFPSVGATETLVLAAATACGVTTLRGAACEPEIADLAAFLNACGAAIRGAGTPVIRVRGCRRLSGAVFAPVADRIFASTLACAVAVAGGRVELHGCEAALYRPVLELLQQMGCTVQAGRGSVSVGRFGPLWGVGRVFTGVYPGLATDAAPLLAAAMLYARGESSIEDVVFENRFACAGGFARMGAKVERQGRCLHVRPAASLHGGEVEAPDLRGGAALALAALGAEGRTRITQTAYIRRGYADLGGTLGALGARVV